MTTMTPAPVEELPDPALLIGPDRLDDASGGTFQHVYAATGQPTAEIPLAGAEEIDRAVRAARAALPGWKATPADRRRDLLLAMAQSIRTNAERLTRLNIVDNATPMLIAGAQNGMAADLFAYNAGWADKVGGEVHETWPIPALDYSREEPFGVVAVIIPWNGPVTAIGQVVAPALAAGNTVVLKPPELAPFAAIEMGRMFLEAGFPPGVVNVVTGGPEGGDALVRHPEVDKIHFTGSGATARAISRAAADNLTPLGLELGGKSAVVVFDDAEIGAAVQTAVGGISLNLAGQGCINGTRVLVQRGLYDAVVAAVADAVGEVEMGDPFDFSTTMGPVVSAGACTRITGVIDDAVAHTYGRLVAGGKRAGGDLADGFYIEPTVFADVDNGSPLAQLEVFGPVQSIIPFDTEAEAVALANGTTYGLASYVHTQNIGRAHRVAAELESGMVWVNGGFGIPPSVPFGGVKQSGYGRIGGRDGVREFTRPKNVWVAL